MFPFGTNKFQKANIGEIGLTDPKSKICYHLCWDYMSTSNEIRRKYDWEKSGKCRGWTDRDRRTDWVTVTESKTKNPSCQPSGDYLANTSCPRLDALWTLTRLTCARSLCQLGPCEPLVTPTPTRSSLKFRHLKSRNCCKMDIKMFWITSAHCSDVQIYPFVQQESKVMQRRHKICKCLYAYCTRSQRKYFTYSIE